jgi:hypothetical protein
MYNCVSDVDYHSIYMTNVPFPNVSRSFVPTEMRMGGRETIYTRHGSLVKAEIESIYAVRWWQVSSPKMEVVDHCFVGRILPSLLS